MPTAVVCRRGLCFKSGPGKTISARAAGSDLCSCTGTPGLPLEIARENDVAALSRPGQLLGPLGRAPDDEQELMKPLSSRF